MLVKYREIRQSLPSPAAAAIILRVVFPSTASHISCSLPFLLCRRKTSQITFCFLFFLLLQEENRGLRLKEELVAAAPRLLPSAVADQTDEDKRRKLLWSRKVETKKTSASTFLLSMLDGYFILPTHTRRKVDQCLDIKVLGGY